MHKEGSCVKVNGTFSDDFLIQLGLHQDSVLSPLLFIIVLEELGQDIQKNCFILMTWH